ncbi:uncharacterized protein VirK/YbjX [Rhodanobacter sp. TND4EL1]
MSAQLFWRSLRDRRDGRGNALQQAGAAIKYALRSARSARLHAAWLNFIYGSPLMSAMLAHDPRLLERAQHHYINRHMGQVRRYAVIADHYRSVTAVFRPDICEAIYLGGRYPLGTLRLKDGSALEIELRRPTGRGREGELCLCLADAQGELLSSMIFSIADGGRTLLLGCMQGAAAGLGREAVRELTRQSYGLRPKNLLLSLLRAFAQRYGIERMRGVANAAHPFAGQADKIKADYDSFWLECEGVLDREGFYELPVGEPVRDAALVVSKHRSAFRQREALRRDACILLLNSLDQHVELALAS